MYYIFDLEEYIKGSDWLIFFLSWMIVAVDSYVTVFYTDMASEMLNSIVAASIAAVLFIYKLEHSTLEMFIYYKKLQDFEDTKDNITDTVDHITDILNRSKI